VRTEPDAAGRTSVVGRVRHTYVSQDRGTTWQQTERFEVGDEPGTCPRVSSMFAPHPTLANRVFRASRCGLTEQPLIEMSDDAVSWSGQMLPVEAGLTVMSGGSGPAGSRLYVAGNRRESVGGSVVFVSKDDGVTWTESLSYVGGGINDDTSVEQTQIWGMVSHPKDSNRVWLGIHRGQDTAPGPTISFENYVGRIITTTDGGETWTDAVSLTDLPLILDLAITPQGDLLYAATQGGLFRLRLSEP
jgi:hypothetical protein